MQKLGAVWFLVSSLAFASASAGAPITVDFDGAGFVHGSVITDQYADLGLTIRAERNGIAKYAVAFDSGLVDPTSTPDPDLLFLGGWEGGNLASEPLGFMLILNRNISGCKTGVCDVAEDEGGKPAGSLFFEFDMPVLSFGFSLIDVEGVGAGQENGSITFTDSESGHSVEIMMSDFLAGLELGNRTANEVPVFYASDLEGLDQFDQVELLMGGSGAVDNVTFTPVPEPATAGMLGLGLGALAWLGRRRPRRAV